MTAPGGTEADRAARERLAREARETATALLDWVGTRVDGAATARADGTSSRPRQSPGPCTWCPVCALVAALRGEQPELTATLAEQASGLLLMLRLLVQAHATGAHEHGAHEPQERPEHEAGPMPAPAEPAASASAAEAPAPQVPWETAPHALFDPDPDPGPEPADHEPSRPAPERPTGKRGPRPSPRRPTAGASSATEPDDDVVASVPAAAAEPRPFPQPVPEPPAPSSPAPGTPAAARATTDRSGRVQRIPVRRRTRSC